MGILICLKNIAGSWDLSLDLTTILDVINLGSENNLLALLTRKPRRLIVSKDQWELGFFATHYEPLLQFAEKATIAVIDEQFILFYDKSQTNLLDMTSLILKNVRVGAETMYFENPYLLALDRTTFTKYDLDGNLLQRYTFRDVVRVVPDHQLVSFALHYSQDLNYDNQIQYVSRKADHMFSILFQSLGQTFPIVLLQLIQDYLPDLSTEIPRSISNVFATLTFVRDRQEGDLSAWKPRTSVTDEVHTAFVEGNYIFLKGGKLADPKLLHPIHHKYFDFEFVAEGIVVFVQPPSEYLFCGGAENGSQLDDFHLGIKDPERAGFYRDRKGALHLMVLTETSTYDYVIGYQKNTKDTSTPEEPTPLDTFIST